MIGLLVATHSTLAAELLKAASMIIGPLENTRSVSVDQGMSVEEAKAEFNRAFEEVSRDGDGVIILTDLFGGTPTNLSADFIQEGQVEVLTGVNLPMIIKCANSREGLSLEGLATMLKEYSRNAIIRPVELLKPNV